MKNNNDDFLVEAVEILHSHDIEHFLIIAENPQPKRKSGEEFRAAFGGKKSLIVAMLMEVFKSKKDNLGFILDAFVSLGRLEKIGQEEELDKLMAELKKG
jgi:hypothetical protein